MKPSSKPRSAKLAALLCTALVVVATAAQAPQGTQGAAAIATPSPLRTFPPPANLKVLPKDLTGRQVHEVMEEWAGSLGVRCDSCHAKNSESTEPGAQPGLDFADDSKPMKAVARLMYTMTDGINSNYIAKVEGSGMPVTCGTCHRGHVSPEPYTVQPAGGPPPAQPSQSVGERPQPQ